MFRFESQLNGLGTLVDSVRQNSYQSSRHFPRRQIYDEMPSIGDRRYEKERQANIHFSVFPNLIKYKQRER